MKKAILNAVAVLMFLGISISVQAQEIYPLGYGNIALKLDYFSLGDTAAFQGAEENGGISLGLEIYGQIVSGLYVGYELAWATQTADFSNNAKVEITYVPMELNMKYIFGFGRSFRWHIGGGVSYNYGEHQVKSTGIPPPTKTDAWVGGGQVFTNLNWIIRDTFIGIDLKYQVTRDFENTDISFDNYRIGAHIGWMF
jgi:hypothetical protein